MTQEVADRGVEQEEPAGTAEVKPALGAPHDAYAATLLTVSLAAAFGTMTLVSDTWWAVLPAALSAGFAASSVHYLRRAHFSSRGARGQAGRLAAGPWALVMLALITLQTTVLQPLHDALGTSWHWAIACLALATLIVAPIQAATSLNPKAREYLTR